jgi:hypothetical protein
LNVIVICFFLFVIVLKKHNKGYWMTFLFCVGVINYKSVFNFSQY